VHLSSPCRESAQSRRERDGAHDAGNDNTAFRGGEKNYRSRQQLHRGRVVEVSFAG
jgi:hypothetical protein